MLISPLHTPPDPLLASRSDGHLLVVDSKGLTWFDGEAHVDLATQPRSVQLSPLGDFAVARLVDGRVLIWNTHDRSVREIIAQSVDATFALRKTEEVVAVLSKHELALWSSSGQLVTRQPLGGLAASALVPVFDGRSLVVCGQEFGESRDTIVLFDASELPISSERIGRRFTFLEGLVDSCNRLAVGPCGKDHVAILRDPNDTEEPLEPGDRAIVPREWGYRGVYVATRDGETVERIDTELVPMSGGTLVAGRLQIAAKTDEGIAVWARHEKSPQRLELRWLAVASRTAVLGLDANQTLQLIELE